MSSYSEKKLCSAGRTISNAEVWRYQNNPEYYAKLETWALDKAARGIKFAVQDWFELLRSKDRVNAVGEPVAVNNSFASVFARWLWLEHPEVRGYVKLRRCPVGAVMGVGCDDR